MLHARPSSSRRKFGPSLIAIATLTLLGGAIPGRAAEHGIGAVYLLSNSATANSVLAYSRAADGSLTPAGTYPTGGAGAVEPGPAPDPLGSQGSLVLAGRFLLAVNAGSNDVSMFAIKDDALVLVDRVPSGGTFPASIAVHDGLVYVLNAGNSGALPNISGFVIDAKAGRLVPLPRSQRPLAGGSTASGADIAFAADGGVLIVTEKGDGIIDTYRVGSGGYASQPVTVTSSGAGPFGFAVTDGHHALVAEAGSGTASSYEVGNDGSMTLLTASLSLAGQMAPCWLVATPDGRYAYTGNAGTGAISLLGVAPSGALTLINPTASGTSLVAPVLDLALAPGGRFLFARDVGNATVSSFAVAADGSLTLAGSAPIPGDDLPAQGIAVR